MTDEELTRREARRKERQAIYNTKRWKDLRDYMRMTHPLCEKCLEKGIVKPMEDVHHRISPFKRGLSPEEKYRLAFDENNLICLCRECHIEEHMKDELTMKQKLDKYKD